MRALADTLKRRAGRPGPGGSAVESPRPAPQERSTPRPSGTTSIRAAGTPSRPHHVISRAVRVDDDPMRTPGRERHEDAHPEGEDRLVGVGKDLVNEVVDRHHPGEAPVQRRRTGERVHQIDPGAPGQAGEVLLLAAYALGATGRPHGDDDRLDQLPERIVGGLEVHERREARAGWSGGEQRLGAAPRAATSIPPVSPGTRKTRLRPTCIRRVPAPRSPAGSCPAWRAPWPPR